MMRYRSGCLLACVLLIVGCSGAGYVEDTPEARGELAGELARMSAEFGHYQQMLDEGVEVARSATEDALAIELGRELTDAEVEGLVASLRSVLAEFVTESMWTDSVVAAYEKHFTASELSDMRDFYASPTGKRMLQLEDAAAADIEASVDSALDGRLDEFIARLDEKISANLPGLTEAGQ